MLNQLLDLMAHAPPRPITAGFLPHCNAVTRAEFHPARAALLDLSHGGITRGIARGLYLCTCPRAGEGCRRSSQAEHGAGGSGILVCCFNCNGKLKT